MWLLFVVTVSVVYCCAMIGQSPRWVKIYRRKVLSPEVRLRLWFGPCRVPFGLKLYSVQEQYLDGIWGGLSRDCCFACQSQHSVHFGHAQERTFFWGAIIGEILLGPRLGPPSTTMAHQEFGLKVEPTPTHFEIFCFVCCQRIVVDLNGKNGFLKCQRQTETTAAIVKPGTPRWLLVNKKHGTTKGRRLGAQTVCRKVWPMVFFSLRLIVLLECLPNRVDSFTVPSTKRRMESTTKRVSLSPPIQKAPHSGSNNTIVCIMTMLVVTRHPVTTREHAISSRQVGRLPLPHGFDAGFLS